MKQLLILLLFISLGYGENQDGVSAFARYVVNQHQQEKAEVDLEEIEVDEEETDNHENSDHTSQKNTDDQDKK